MADLGRAVAFYRDVVGLPVALEIPERGATFFWVVEPGQACSASGRSARCRWA